MKYKVTKLKRYKIIANTLGILVFPIRFPIWLVHMIGTISETLLDSIDLILVKLLEKIAEVFKFEEVANKQYEANKDKFKMYN